MLIEVNEEQNKRVEELLDEGIANLGIPIANTDINIPPLSFQNDIKYNPESNINLNLENNENYNFNYNTESSFDLINQNNFENNNKIKKDSEKKKPNYIYYGGENRKNNIINKTIDALNTGLIIPSNKKRDIEEYKNEDKKNKSYDNYQMGQDKNGFKNKKNKKIPNLMKNKIKNKNDSNKNLNNDIYEYDNFNNVNENLNHKISNEDNIIINNMEYRPKDLKKNQKQNSYRNNSNNRLMKNNYSFNYNENKLNINSNSFQNTENNEYFENYNNYNINNINNNNYIKIQDNIGKIPINKNFKKHRTKPKIKQSKINYEWKEKYEEIKKLNNNALKQLQKVKKENMIIEDKLNEVKFESENENISAMKSYLLRRQINYDKLNNDFQISENTRIKQVALIDKLEKEIKYIKSILLRQKGYN